MVIGKWQRNYRYKWPICLLTTCNLKSPENRLFRTQVRRFQIREKKTAILFDSRLLKNSLPFQPK